MSIISIIDITLSLSLIWIAWRAIMARDLFKSVVFFITLGLILSLSWIRLNAIDIALAEAAIGAGLTGVLLLDAVDHLSKRPKAKLQKVKK